MTFAEKLDAAIQLHTSLLCLGLDPNPEMLPQGGNQSSASGKQKLKRWLEIVVEQTKALVCAYKPTLGFYLALGSEGLDLLTEVLSLIPAHIPVILDAKHGDLNTASQLSKTFLNSGGWMRLRSILTWDKRALHHFCFTPIAQYLL